MEIEASPVTLDQRLDYLNTLEVNQNEPKQSFPWLVAFIFFVGGIVLTAYLNARKKDDNK